LEPPSVFRYSCRWRFQMNSADEPMKLFFQIAKISPNCGTWARNGFGALAGMTNGLLGDQKESGLNALLIQAA
jgi:hypothetical protein